MNLHKVIVTICGLIVFTVAIGGLSAALRGKTSSQPRTEYIPLCWNQTIPNVPMYHPAARCNGIIKR